MKFGGTSVNGAERLAAAARIVRSRLDEAPVVVTSAMAGVTDHLTRLLEVALSGDRAALDDGVRALGERHVEAARRVAPGDDGLLARLDARLRELRVLLRGLRLVGAVTPRASDAVLGAGELLAQELLAAALAAAGAPAELIDSREVVVTDEQFGAARPDREETARRAAERVRPVVDAGRTPVLGGYIGATRSGAPTTLGRGGSDLSASVLALALGAATVEIWTDVDGLFTADPREAPAARVLSRASFDEATELAALGAKVLHPASIAPAIEGGLPVVIRNSLAPDRPGTRIDGARSLGNGVRAVASRSGLDLVTLRATGGAGAEFQREALARISAGGLQPLIVTVGPTGLDILATPGPLLDAAARALADLGLVQRRTGLALVAVVGDALVRDFALTARVLEVAAAARPLRATFASAGSSLAVVVEAPERAALVRALHRDLIEKE
jgi:aspartate kinase